MRGIAEAEISTRSADRLDEHCRNPYRKPLLGLNLVGILLTLGCSLCEPRPSYRGVSHRVAQLDWLAQLRPPTCSSPQSAFPPAFRYSSRAGLLSPSPFLRRCCLVLVAEPLLNEQLRGTSLAPTLSTLHHLHRVGLGYAHFL